MARKTFQYPGLQPNARYAIQIRGIDEDDNPGRWSSAFEFETSGDQMAPAPVTNLTVEVDGADFVINWDGPTTNDDGSDLEDLRDYVLVITAGGDTRVHYTVDEGIVFSFNMNRNTFVVPRPSITVDVYARDRVRNMSSAVSQSATNSVPTAPLLAAAAKRNAIELSWTDAFDGDGRRYEIWKNSIKYADVSAGTQIWTDTDVGEGPQSYIVRAVDLFDQTADSNEQIEGEITIEFETDEVAPKPPTGLAANDDVLGTSGLLTLSWDAPVQDTDNTSYTDQEGFEVRYRVGVSRPWTYRRVPDLRADATVAQRFELDVDSVAPGVTLDWEVRAFDRSFNYSTWAIDSVAVAEDTTPPAAPTGLEAAGGIRTIVAGWNANTEDDIAGYRLYASTTPGVAIAGEPKFDGLGTSASFTAGDDETWYLVVVAYDHSGNVSAASTEESATSMGSVIDDVPPTDVTGLTLTKQFYYHGAAEFARINAAWNPATDDSGIYGYVVAWQRTDEGTVDPNGWTEDIVADRTRYTLTGLDIVDVNQGESGEENAVQPATYAFKVMAIDANGNFSTNWSPVVPITLDDNGEAASGEIKREVPISSGALQSENFVNLLRGWRLSDNALEIYGDEQHEVSILLGSGGEGLNLSTINSELWFGASSFDDATWRVGPGGDMRVGGPGAIAERLEIITNFIATSPTNTTPEGQYVVFSNTTTTPTASGAGDLWADGTTVYEWSGTVWVDLADETLRVAIRRVVSALLLGEGALNVAIGPEPATPAQYDVWEDAAGVLYLFDGDEWERVRLEGGSLYASAAGDLWSGSEDPFQAPWRISRSGRATFGNIRIAPTTDMPDNTDLLYVSSDDDAPLLVLSKIDAANWEFRIGMDTYIEAGGHLQLSGGDLSLTSGNVTLNGGIFTMSSGALNLTGTPVTMDGSDFNIKSGNIVLEEGVANDVDPTGIIKSADYSYQNRTGWALDSGNLYLFSGEIDASLINIQREQNLLEYGYTTMPYQSEWYEANLQVTGLVASLTGLWSRYGANGLRLFGTTGDTVEFVELVNGQPNYSNIRVDPDTQYIYSAYVYNNNTVTAKDVQLYVVQADGQSIESGVFTIPPSEYQRVSYVFTVDSNNFGLYCGIRVISTDSDFIVDGLQLEAKVADLDGPSTFNIGGATRIDGDAIRTGSIISNNYQPGMSGFRINMNGAVEFQGGVFRGQLFAEDFVSGTIANQNLLLSRTDSYVIDPELDEGWQYTEILGVIPTV